eukprot:TRINITY_DN6701_c0_g2_i1.p1 TRINITY_DN6701_c0_g2~~TRINITY_DN6701_c0_g2_i1.p1  ORF type:complete len:562 (-),score=104.18 TRINITY_DN6701_c0_g2_i1:234-1919(-)
MLHDCWQAAQLLNDQVDVIVSWAPALLCFSLAEALGCPLHMVASTPTVPNTQVVHAHSGLYTAPFTWLARPADDLARDDPLNTTQLHGSWQHWCHVSHLIAHAHEWADMAGLINKFRTDLLELPPLTQDEFLIAVVTRLQLTQSWSSALYPQCGAPAVTPQVPDCSPGAHSLTALEEFSSKYLIPPICISLTACANDHLAPQIVSALCQIHRPAVVLLSDCSEQQPWRDALMRCDSVPEMHFEKRSCAGLRWILPRCSVLMSCGQSTELHHALSHGVPVLVLERPGNPLNFWGERIEQAGYGLLVRDSSPDQIAAALHCLPHAGPLPSEGELGTCSERLYHSVCNQLRAAPRSIQQAFLIKLMPPESSFSCLVLYAQKQPKPVRRRAEVSRAVGLVRSTVENTLVGVRMEVLGAEERMKEAEWWAKDQSTPKSTKKGLQVGVNRLRDGVVDGISGLVFHTLDGASKKNVSGVAQGVTKGLSGLATGVGKGLTGFIGSAAGGIGNSLSRRIGRSKEKAPAVEGATGTTISTSSSSTTTPWIRQEVSQGATGSPAEESWIDTI